MVQPQPFNISEEQTAQLPENLQVAAATIKRTRGEKFFDFFTYKIINFGVNEVLSLGITDWFLGGTDRNDGKATSYFANKMGERGIKVSDKLYHLQKGLDAKVGATAGAVFTLNLGGHITAGMVKLLENNRVNLSRRFDNMFDSLTGTKKTAEEIAHRETRYEILRNTPLKTGKQVIWGRISAMLSSMALNQLPEWIDEKVLKNSSTHGRYGIRRLTGAAGHYIDRPITAAMQSRRKEPMTDMAKKRVSYWSELVLFETWCTWLTSFVMEKVVKWNDKDHHQAAAEQLATPKSEPIAHRTDSSNETAERTQDSPKKSAPYAARFSDEPEEGKDKKRWSNRGYDYEDEVGVQL